MPPDQPEDIELSNLDPAHSNSSSTSVPVQFSRQKWHPKLTPYRLLSVLLPVCLGTVKAVALQQGKNNEPITLEWISGVVVFIVLFNTGTYESRPIQHIPAYLAWLFRYDCMDVVWWLCSSISRGLMTRPRYISDEVRVEGHGTIYIVTSYRLLVCATVVIIGMLKAALTYGGISTGATWVEWLLGAVISSALYIIGLYESNTIGLWPSFFGTDRAYVVRNGLTGTSKLLFILISLALMSMWFLIERPLASPDASTQTELPVVLRAYNQSMKIMVEAVFVMLFLLGAVVLFASLRSLREDLGDRVRMPLRIRVFALWVASFYSSAYAIPTSFHSRSSTFTFTRLWAAVRSLTYAIRHVLFFLLASFLIILAFSFSAGQGYRYATGDLLLKDKHGNTRGSGWGGVIYAGLGLFGTVIIIPASVVVVWSLKEILKAARDVYTTRCAPLINQVRAKMRERKQKIKKRVQREAVRVVLGMTGLSDADNVHYAFLELAWVLRADNESEDARLRASSSVHATQVNKPVWAPFSRHF